MPDSLPIHQALPALKTQLQTQRVVVLQAPPGAGKSTVLPLELLDQPWLRNQPNHRILMLEPRRLAARSVATRMAHALGETVGQTVGYRVRFEQRVSPQTQLEVLTEGILTRRLQQDQALGGVGLVIFDEFHERGLQADLALALCREVQQVLRDDLRILIMSATLDSGALLSALNMPPFVTASGRQYPVALQYLFRDLDAPLHAVVADAVSSALVEHAGDVLVFLPGVSEIQRVQTTLTERHPDLAVCPLYGELSLEAQQVALLPDGRGRRKVVLATSIAETSLTIEGIRVVVDSGFSRVPRFDARTGLTRLETVRVTLDSADQRAGRAGRLAPGVCVRLWSTSMHNQLKPTRTPEILEADLAPLQLELAQWGARQATDLQWITAPPTGAVRQAQLLLQQLGALRNNVLTERGRAMLDLPTHPRLAHLLLESQTNHQAREIALATDLAAVLDERDPLPRGNHIQVAGADLTLRVEALRQWRQTQRSIHGADVRMLARIERIAAQWRKQLNVRVDNAPPDASVLGWLVALAYPDRIAQAREANSNRYRLSGGRGVTLNASDPLVRTRWLAVAHLDAGGASTAEEGRIFLAAALPENFLDGFATEHERVGWDARQGALVARRERRIGELVVSSQPIHTVPAEQKTLALCAAVRAEGLAVFRWTDDVRQWQARVQSLRAWRGQDGFSAPDVSDDALLVDVEHWLAAWLEGVTKRDDFMRLDMLNILRALLPYKQHAQLDVLAPTHLLVPSGSSIALSYAADGTPPVLAVKLQEMFGLADTPTVNDGRTPVLLHLLSPARRPIQVTQDLRSFWSNTYPSVRKELRGRYNKHPWPEDPWNALPTRKTVKASAAERRD